MKKITYSLPFIEGCEFKKIPIQGYRFDESINVSKKKKIKSNGTKIKIG